MSKVHYGAFPGEQPPRGGGPEGPSMEQRVARLEEQFASIDAKLTKMSTLDVQLAEIKGQLSQMPKASDWATLRAEIAEIKGKVSNIPSTWQLVPLLLTTWAAGAAIVFALLRFSAK